MLKPVPSGFFLTDDIIEGVHVMLISVWQENIKNWYAGKDLPIYLKVKIDGLPIPKGTSRLVKGPKINQYVGTVPSTFHVL